MNLQVDLLNFAFYPPWFYSIIKFISENSSHGSEGSQQPRGHNV